MKTFKHYLAEIENPNLLEDEDEDEDEDDSSNTTVVKPPENNSSADNRSWFDKYLNPFSSAPTAAAPIVDRSTVLPAQTANSAEPPSAQTSKVTTPDIKTPVDSNRDEKYSLLTRLDEPPPREKYTPADFSLSSAPLYKSPGGALGTPMRGSDNSPPPAAARPSAVSPTTPPPVASPPPPPPAVPQQPLTVPQGSKDPKIEKLQELLKNNGYYNGPVNGVATDELRKAVEKYKQGKNTSSTSTVPTSTNRSSTPTAPAPENRTPVSSIIQQSNDIIEKYMVSESMSPVEQIQRLRQIIDESEMLEYQNLANPPSVSSGAPSALLKSTAAPTSSLWKTVANSPVGKLAGRVIPGTGTALGAYDIYNRGKHGDTVGATISGITTAASSLPVIGTAAAILGVSVQALRDKIRTGAFLPGEEELIAAATRDAVKKVDSSGDLKQLNQNLIDLQARLQDKNLSPQDRTKIETTVEKIKKFLTNAQPIKS
jgi:hypothetical protein